MQVTRLGESSQFHSLQLLDPYSEASLLFLTSAIDRNRTNIYGAIRLLLTSSFSIKALNRSALINFTSHEKPKNEIRELRFRRMDNW
jgi:hypothetical protein